MNYRKVILIFVGVILFVGASGTTFFFAHRTFTTTGQSAVNMMNREERAALDKLMALQRTMDREAVYELLGPPSEDLLVLAKWRGFGNSILSEARVYFVNGHPFNVRWIKLGFFVHERKIMRSSDPEPHPQPGVEAGRAGSVP